MVLGIFDDDPFDLDRPEGLVLAAGSGILDDEVTCTCWCECLRRVEWPDDTCSRCQAGRHRDPLDQVGDER